MFPFQDQYVFVYDCLLEALISGDTLMRADEYQDILSEMCQFDNAIQKTKLEEQFDVIIFEINYWSKFFISILFISMHIFERIMITALKIVRLSLCFIFDVL